MTDAIAILAAVLLLVVLAGAWHRWGRGGLAVVAVGAGALVAIVAGLASRRRRPVARDPEPGEAERQARAAIAEDIRAGERAIEDARRAHEAAVRLHADIDTADDAGALTAHLVARSKGER